MKKSKLKEAVKQDDGKVQLSLLSSLWLFGVGKVLTYGAKKYSADNWRGGFSYRRLLDAAQRHLLAFQNGEDLDPETRLSHILHASCCLMFIYENQMRHPSRDDRYKGDKNVPMPKVYEEVKK